MLLRTIPPLQREHEIVAYIGDDISVHVFRDGKGHLRMGIHAEKRTVVVDDDPRPIRIAKPR